MTVVSTLNLDHHLQKDVETQKIYSNGTKQMLAKTLKNGW